MSWHYSQALVEAFLAANCWDGERFAPLKETDAPATYCWRDKTTEAMNLFQFGMTCGPSTDDPGVALLTWFQAGFRVRTSASRGRCGGGMAWPASTAGYGGRTCALLGRFSQPRFSVKTRLLSAPADWLKSWPDLPPSGMYAGGRHWELTLSDLITGASGCGSTLPTPTARDWKDTLGMWDTRKDGKTRLDRLPMLVFDHARLAGLSMQTDWARTSARTVTVGGVVQAILTGPDYCPSLPEWVMCWPVGWTDTAPLATDKFRQWLRWHGSYSD